MEIERCSVVLIGIAWLGICAGCGPDVQAAEQAELSPNPCTAVKLTSPSQDFTGAAGDPIVLTGAATCPVGQTPEYQYWFKPYGAPDWSHLPPYVLGSLTWMLPSDGAWCVSVVARAVGAPENYQTRSSTRCTAPRCGNGAVERGEQCDDSNSVSGDGCEPSCMRSSVSYLKASNPGLDNFFGHGIALSSDGTTLVAGAYGEGGSSGAVYVFVQSGGAWIQQAYLKASNPDANDLFGYSVALSADGATLAVGAGGEDSSATGSGGDQSDNSRSFAGAVYVFTRNGTTWSQQAYLKSSNPDVLDVFGTKLAISADGSTLAVAATLEDSGATTVDGDQRDNSEPDAGAVYVFTRSGAAWSQQAYLKGSGSHAGAGLGYGLAISASGSLLAAGAPFENAGGAVYIFTRGDGMWTQRARITAPYADYNDGFGWGLALSAGGATLAAGAPGEASAATGIDGDQTDNTSPNAGAVYIFEGGGTAWTQVAYLKASNTDPVNLTGLGDNFGIRAALSPDGNVLAVSAPFEGSAATGINGDQSDNSLIYAGAVYRFARTGATWSQQAYVKATNTGQLDSFGYDLTVIDDGTLAVGALGESSAASGPGGDQSDNSMTSAGAVYVFR